MVDEHVWRAPATGLRPFVSWYSGYRQAGVAPRRHRGLPSGWLTFIVTLDDPLFIDSHPDPRQAAAAYDTLLGGLHTSPALITHDGRQSGIQLALTPLGARRLVGVPAGELANFNVPATEVFGAFAAELRERVAAERTWDERFAVIDSLLERRVAGAGSGCGDGARPEVAHAWRRLRTSHGAVSVAELAAETGWSARHLNSLFHAELGLSPKEAARVVRFDHARRRIARAARAAAPAAAAAGAADAPGMGLADLAAECGYYDQAHLAREFRSLAGCPPTQWLAEEFRFVQAMPAEPEE